MSYLEDFASFLKYTNLAVWRQGWFVGGIYAVVLGITHILLLLTFFCFSGSTE